MNSSSAVSVDASKRTRPHDRARFFYTGAAAMLLVLMFLGFQQFYLHGKAFPNRPLAPPIRTLLITHGIAMSAWMVLLLVQPLLVVNYKYRVHMTLGKAGAVLAACIFILGFKLGIEATRVIPAALDRIDAISSLYRHTVWGTIFGPFFSSLVIGAVFLVVKWALTRSFDRYYALGWAGLVVASAGIMKLATTQA